jgi:hypothetical protein
LNPRLLLAAVVFFASASALVGGFMALIPPDASELLITVGVLTAIAISLVLTNKLANAPGTNFWSFRKAPDPEAEEQDDDESLTVAAEYRAVRWFRVEGARGEGPQYFIELQDRSVLHLQGTYLDPYDSRKTRRFPSALFVMRRDRYDGTVVDIRCRGVVLEPELTVKHFRTAEGSEERLQDGEIVANRTYEECKTRYAQGRGSAVPSDRTIP